MTTVLVELIVGGLLLTVGDLVFKYELHHLTWLWWGAGLAFYLAGLIFLVRTYAYENIAVASALLVIFNIIALTIASALFFKEPVTPLQALGLALSFGAIFLLHP